MDCDLARIQPQVCFSKVEEVVIFAQLISDFPSLDEGEIHEDSFVDEHIFLISTTNRWCGKIIFYLQTLKVPSHLS